MGLVKACAVNEVNNKEKNEGDSTDNTCYIVNLSLFKLMAKLGNNSHRAELTKEHRATKDSHIKHIVLTVTAVITVVV